MTVPVESFIAVIKRSGLVDGSVLTKSYDTFSATEPEVTAETFANHLIQNDIITDWQADKLKRGKHKGFFLGKYKLLRILGKGGMSSVYLAEHVLMRRRCAIKVLPHKRVDESSYLDRFYREAQAVAALDHPNIVRAYDVDHEKDGNLEINFLVMEYVKGQNLYELVQREGVQSPVKAADLIRQGALGLEHAHKAGLVHRDVKPGNFLIDEQQTVRLMDLGLARVYEENDDNSLTIEHDEKVLGTADYLAPEQAVDSHSVDARADIYGLGCTMYYLLVGHPPFNEGTLTQRLLAHQTKEPPSIETLRDDIPASLLDIIHGMMKKKPDERTQTAGEVVDTLTDWLNENGGDEWEPPEDRLSRTSDSDASSPTRRRDKPENRTKPESGSKVEEELGSFLTTLNESSANISLPAKPQKSSIIKKATEVVKKTVSTVTTPAVDEEVKTAIDPLKSTQKVTNLDSQTITPPTKSKPKKTITEIEITQPQQPSPKEQSAPQPKPSVSSGNQTRRNVLIAIAALIVLGGIFAFFRGGENEAQSPEGTVKNGQPVTPPPKVERPPVSGTTVSVGPKGNFGTVQEALDYINNAALSNGGQSIIKEVRVAAAYKVTTGIQIDNAGLGTFPKGIKITGEGPEFPILSNKSSDPVISLQAIEKLTIENFIVDAKDRQYACELGGYLVGTRLINLTFKNVNFTAIQASGVTGVGNERVVIDRCRFVASASDANFIACSPSDNGNTRKLVIQNSQFIGPARTAISLAETSWDVEIKQNIFHELNTAILFRGEKQDLNSIKIGDNTFHKLQRGVDFESGPGPVAAKFTLYQNLFVGIEDQEVSVASKEMNAAALSKGTSPMRNNLTDRSNAGEGNSLNIFADQGHTGKAVEFQSEDPQNANFLKPKGPTLRQLVKNKVGTQNFIGAVSP